MVEISLLSQTPSEAAPIACHLSFCKEKKVFPLSMWNSGMFKFEYCENVVDSIIIFICFSLENIIE